MLTEERMRRYDERVAGRLAPGPALRPRRAPKNVIVPQPTTKRRRRVRRRHVSDENLVWTLRRVAEHEYGHDKESGRYFLLTSAADRIEALAALRP